MRIMSLLVIAVMLLTLVTLPTGFSLATASVDTYGNVNYFGAFEGWIDFFGNLTSFINDTYNLITKGIQNLIRMFQNIYDWISDVFDPVIRFFTNIGKWFTNAYYDFLEFIGIEKPQELPPIINDGIIEDSPLPPIIVM